MLTQEFTELVRACFTGVWVESAESGEAIREISRVCHGQGWGFGAWSISSGLVVGGQVVDDSGDPLSAIRAAGALPGDGARVLVLRDFHRFLNNPEILGAIADQCAAGKADRTILVILSPVVSLPPELQKLFVVVEHELPSREILGEIAGDIAEGDELPSGADFGRLIDSAAGLTRSEAENAFALSLVRNGRLDPSVVWGIKSQSLLKGGLLKLHQGGESFAQLGGLDNLKAFCKAALLSSSEVQARGVLLLSPPGCGKSQFCKALGSEVGRPVVILDVGALLGGLVGESEANTRRALATIDAMAPCVLMIDEIEKAFAGVGSSNDGGVKTGIFGSFLTWLNDHKSDVFTVATSNNIGALPPEFARAERFDGVFFVDLPDADQRQRIWDIYLDAYQINRGQDRPNCEGWTGAEIKSCCRLSALLGVSLVQAADNVVPVSVSGGDAVERLRTWANGRCLSADNPGRYQFQAKQAARRKVTRKPQDDTPSVN